MADDFQIDEDELRALAFDESAGASSPPKEAKQGPQARSESAIPCSSTSQTFVAGELNQDSSNLFISIDSEHERSSVGRSTRPSKDESASKQRRSAKQRALPKEGTDVFEDWQLEEEEKQQRK